MENIEKPFGTGARPRPKDERDYEISLGEAGAPIFRPDSFASPVNKIYMQGTLGSCGAHAGAALANVLFNATTSPKFLWKIIKSFDGYGLNDGTDMRSIFKALQNTGICDYSLMPNPSDDYAGVTIESYSNINEVTQAMRDNAATRKIASYSFLDIPSMDQIKDAIYQHKAVILLVDIGDGWWLPSWQAANPLHLGHLTGHHFICATQYGFTLIDGPNSWSVAWGDKGMFNFNNLYIPHVLEMGVATVNAIPTPEPVLVPVTKYSFTRNLGILSWGSDVKALQLRLGVNPTGFFWRATLQAVYTFQNNHNLPPTGYVDEQMRAILNA